MSEFARKLWKKERLEQLRSLAGTMPIEEIAATMGLSVKQIKDGATTYQISVAFKKKIWTEEMDDYVIKYAGKVDSKLIADAVGVTRAALSYRACYVLDVSLRVLPKYKRKQNGKRKQNH